VTRAFEGLLDGRLCRERMVCSGVEGGDGDAGGEWDGRCARGLSGECGVGGSVTRWCWENWSVGRLRVEGAIQRTWSLCLEMMATLSGVPDFEVALGFDVDTEAAEAAVLLPLLERSFSSSSSSYSSRLFTASNHASIQFVSRLTICHAISWDLCMI